MMRRTALWGLVLLMLAPSVIAAPRFDHVFTAVPTVTDDDDGTIHLGYHHCPLVSLDGVRNCHHAPVGSVRVDFVGLYRFEHVAVGACYLATCAGEQVDLPAVLP